MIDFTDLDRLQERAAQLGRRLVWSPKNGPKTLPGWGADNKVKFTPPDSAEPMTIDWSEVRDAKPSQFSNVGFLFASAWREAVALQPHCVGAMLIDIDKTESGFPVADEDIDEFIESMNLADSVAFRYESTPDTGRTHLICAAPTDPQPGLNSRNGLRCGDLIFDVRLGRQPNDRPGAGVHVKLDERRLALWLENLDELDWAVAVSSETCARLLALPLVENTSGDVSKGAHGAIRKRCSFEGAALTKASDEEIEEVIGELVSEFTDQLISSGRPERTAELTREVTNLLNGSISHFKKEEKALAASLVKPPKNRDQVGELNDKTQGFMFMSCVSAARRVTGGGKRKIEKTGVDQEWFQDLLMGSLEDGGLALNLRFNKRSDAVEIKGPSDAYWRELNDRKLGALAGFLSNVYEVGRLREESRRRPAKWEGEKALELTNSQVRKWLDAMSEDSARDVDPLLEWLESLPNWDETPRLFTHLIELFGLEDTEINRWASAYGFLGVVQRAKQPGCALDEFPILVSEKQGVGKSTYVRMILDNPEMFVESLSFRMGAEVKRLGELMRGAAVIELAEMTGITNPRYTEEIKAFLTARSDKYRPAYGRDAISHKRDSIFYGTANVGRRGVLPDDKSGNRRFVTIRGLEKCHWRRIADYMNENREQLFAEALAHWGAGRVANLPDELAAERDELNKEMTYKDDDIAIRVGQLDKAKNYTLKFIMEGRAPNGDTIVSENPTGTPDDIMEEHRGSWSYGDRRQRWVRDVFKKELQDQGWLEVVRRKKAERVEANVKGETRFTYWRFDEFSAAAEAEAEE